MRWWRFGAVVGLVVLCVPVVTLVMVVTHEVGHTVVARLLGDTRARFLLYGRGCIGCNLYDSARLTPWGNAAVSLGGVLFTALLTITAVVVLAWRGRPAWLPRWLLAEVIVICYGGDLVWQFIQAMQQLPVPAREPLGWGLGYTDLDAATSFGSQATAGVTRRWQPSASLPRRCLPSRWRRQSGGHGAAESGRGPGTQAGHRG